MTCMQELCKLFDWTIISNGTLVSDTHTYSILLIWNAQYSKKIAIKLGPVNRIEVYVKKFNNSNEMTTNGGISAPANCNDTNTNDVFDDLGDNDDGCINLEWLAAVKKTFSKIDINDSYPGRTLMAKFELFLADMAFN